MRKIDKAEEVLRAIEQASKTHAHPEVGAHRKDKIEKKYFLPIVGRRKGKLLERLVKKQKPKRILEVGTLVGYSAIIMARHLKNGRIISLEIDRKAAEIAKRNIEAAGLSDRVDIIVDDAKRTINKLGGKFDFIFIDAAKEEYLTYLKLAEDKIKKGAIIVADNAKMFAEHMEDYLDYVRNSGKYKSRFYDFSFDGVEVSIKL